jgi:hypothetical protein
VTDLWVTCHNCLARLQVVYKQGLSCVSLAHMAQVPVMCVLWFRSPNDCHLYASHSDLQDHHLCCVVLQTPSCRPCGCKMRLQWYCHGDGAADVLLQLVMLRCGCIDPFSRGRAAPSWQKCVAAICATCFCVALLPAVVLFPCQYGS